MKELGPLSKTTQVFVEHLKSQFQNGTLKGGDLADSSSMLCSVLGSNLAALTTTGKAANVLMKLSDALISDGNDAFLDIGLEIAGAVLAQAHRDGNSNGRE